MKSTAHSRDATPAELHAVMDVEDALGRLGNDEDLLREIIKIYLEDAPELLDKIHVAIANDDGSSLMRAAHSLKGLAATLSAQEVFGVAVKLEHLGVARNLAEAAKTVAEVDQQVAALNDAVSNYLRLK